MTNSKINQIFRWQRVHLVLAVYGLLLCVGAFTTAFTFSQNLSTQKLVLLIGMSLAGSLMAFVALKAYRNQTWAERIWSSIFGREILAKGILWAAGISLLAGWFITCTPAYQFGDFQDYFIRLFPLAVFLLFVNTLTFIVAWIEKYGLYVSSLLDTFRAEKKILLIVLAVMTAFVLIWIFIAVTGMGVTSSDGFWYITGVPILGLQILLAFAIGISVFFLEKSSLVNYLPKWADLFVFILLWGVSAFLWVREPLPPSFFVPGPYAPNFEYHPYSDAATFDLGGQFALIGQGINNGVFFDRALYMAFLVYLHALAGQDYIQVVAIQAAIYAVFPAILYLLGKAIHSRSFGIILAVLTTLRGINGIAASTMIDLSNQKQMLTDFPAVIFVALIALLIVKWLKSPAQNYLYILWIGGVTGLGIMLRTNLLFLALFAGLLIVFIYWRQKLQGAILGMLLIVAMFAATFSWGTYHDLSIFDVYLYRIRLVIQSRYPQPSTPVPAPPQGNGSPLFVVASQNQEVASLNPAIGMPVAIENAGGPEESSILYFVTTHFLHNMVTSVLILPTSPVFYDLKSAVKDVFPFWQFYWNGVMSVSDGFFLTVNLLLIALGIGTSWRLSKLSGLIPLGAFLFYDLANAFARTSGGRYLVPMDWVALFYFALGLFQIMLWGMKLFGAQDDSIEEKTTASRDDANPDAWTWPPLKKAPLIILLFLLIGSSLPLSEKLFSKRYPVQSQAELLDDLEQNGYLREMGFDKSGLTAFSEQYPNFRIVSGRALYPRFFAENRGLPKERFPYSILGFPRIAFTVIGPEGLNYALLPGDDIPFFPNASDVIVLGCQQGAAIDALAVVVVNEQTTVYTRQPPSPLKCPLQQPVCDENHVCR